MSMVIAPIGGGGGLSSDEFTATKADVLVGKIAGVSGSDEPEFGTMPNQAAKTASLNCGGSYTIPAGYHNGNGKITANSLSSQTSATAGAGDILSGKTAWVNGSKLTGTMTVQSILSFSAAPTSSSQITCTWKNPVRGPFSGVIIVGKAGSYPTSITDGTRHYKGAGNNSTANGTSTQVISSLIPSTTYYFRAFSYVTKNNTEWVSTTTYTATATTAALKGSQTFTSSGTFTVPNYVTKIDVFCVGGGGGGSSPSGGVTAAAPSGGGGGYTATKKGYAVSPGQTFGVTIGAGGVHASQAGTGGTGGTTTFGNVLSASGGLGGQYGRGVRGPGGAGGSGGGGGNPDDKRKSGAAGGSNGSAGNGGTAYVEGSSITKPGGSGQGTTTRAYAESSGTLYSGGGGGTSSGGAGSGGGGKAGIFWQNSTASTETLALCYGANGTANTGGGGGGGGCHYTNSGNTNNYHGGNGGTGICLIRWGY